MTHTPVHEAVASEAPTGHRSDLPDAAVLRDYITAAALLVCLHPNLGAMRQVAAIAAALGLPPSTAIVDGARCSTSPTDTIGRPDTPTDTTLTDLTKWLHSHSADPDTTPLLHSDGFSVEVNVLGVEGSTCAEHSYHRSVLVLYTDPECLQFCQPRETGAAAVLDRLEHSTGGGTFVDAIAQLQTERYPAEAIVDGVVAYLRAKPETAPNSVGAPPREGE